MKRLQALIVGKGKVGTALSKALNKREWASRFFEQRNDMKAFRVLIQKVDVVFITISTKDEGQEELDYVTVCLESGIPVVTCAKGMLAYQFDKVRSDLPRIGFTASVGGNSGMLKLLTDAPRKARGIKRIVFTPNGSLNFSCSSLQRPDSTEEATFLGAWQLELLEPEAKNLRQALMAEVMVDSLRKAAIVYNVSGLGSIVKPDSFNPMEMSGDYMIELMRVPGTRFVVEIRRARHNARNMDCFWFQDGPWLITGSFQKSASRLFRNVPIDCFKCAMILRRNGGSKKAASGLGAGSSHTAERMIANAFELLTARIP